MNNVNITIYETLQSVLNTEGTLTNACFVMASTSPRRIYYVPGPQYVRIQRIAENVHLPTSYLRDARYNKHRTVVLQKARLTPEIFWYSDAFYLLLRERWQRLHHGTSLRTLTSENIQASKRALALVDLYDQEQAWTCQLHTKMPFQVKVAYQSELVENFDNVTQSACANN